MQPYLKEIGLDKGCFTIDVFIGNLDNVSIKKGVKIIELNPLETSNWFLFHPFRDRELVKNGPFELRLPSKEAEKETFDLGEFPESWKEILI